MSSVATHEPEKATHRVHHHATDEQRRSRWAVFASSFVAAGALIGSYFLPYWNFQLVAPQYPMGLKLQINLFGITGDVKEIDILNHYIGMQSMANAAAIERAASTYIVAAVAIGVVLGLVAAGKRVGWFGILPALGLPLGFLADTEMWMYKFGHELDPDQPINFPPFMPVLLGHGTIGQFHTTAYPAAGFWLACVAALGVTAAVLLRRRICDTCPKASTCGAKCSQLMVLPFKDRP